MINNTKAKSQMGTEVKKYYKLEDVIDSVGYVSVVTAYKNRFWRTFFRFNKIASFDTIEEAKAEALRMKKDFLEGIAKNKRFQLKFFR